MTAAVIDGKAHAAALRARVATAVADLQATHGITPGLAVVLVGEDPASQVYVRSKERMTGEMGMHSRVHRLPAETPQSALIDLVRSLNDAPDIHGILVQFPLPAGLDQQDVIETIAREKDVDGFHPENVGRLSSGLPGLVPCTPLGCLMLLRAHLGDLSGHEAVVIGRSSIVGKPLAQHLLNASATVTVAHSRTRDLAEVVRRADIVIAAVGRPEMVRGDWLKPGCTVIDVGINRLPGTEPGKTRLVGDVAFAEAQSVADAITPVPGGVGPMTIACLLANTVTATCRAAGLPVPEGLGV